MSKKTLTAEEFADTLGAHCAHLLGWSKCTATAVESTGGGCTVTRIDFTVIDTGRRCSLILMDDEHGALSGANRARMRAGDDHSDGERVSVAVYNGDDWEDGGTNYTGSDLGSDRPFHDYATLVNHCAKVLRDWEQGIRLRFR